MNEQLEKLMKKISQVENETIETKTERQHVTSVLQKSELSD